MRRDFLILAWVVGVISIVLLAISNGAGTSISSHDFTQVHGSSETIYTSSKLILGNLALLSFKPYEYPTPSQWTYYLFPNSLIAHTESFGSTSTASSLIIIEFYEHIWRGPGGNTATALNNHVYESNTHFPVWKNNAAGFTFHILAILATGVLLVALLVQSTGGQDYSGSENGSGKSNGKRFVCWLAFIAAACALVGTVVVTGQAVNMRSEMIKQGWFVDVGKLGSGILAMLWIGTIAAMLLPICVVLGTRVAERTEDGRTGLEGGMGGVGGANGRPMEMQKGLERQPRGLTQEKGGLSGWWRSQREFQKPQTAGL